MNLRHTQLALALAALVSPALAAAETQLNHAAGFCQQSGSDGTLVRYWQGTVGNSHGGQDLHLLCPLVRVSGQDSTGTVNVHVIDKSVNSSVRCSFYNQRAYGHAWSWSGWSSSVGSGPNNYRTFTFGPEASQDKFDGWHHVYCILPPADPTHGPSILGSYSSGDM